LKECVVCSRCLDDRAASCPDDGASLRDGIPGPRLLDGKYELERRLGEGGMGVVFRALHIALGRPFAVKVIRARSASAPAYLSRFRTEAVALGRLEHEGIVNVTDFGVDPRDGGLAYLVMELLDGVSLEARSKESSPPGLEESLDILRDVAEAVDYAHGHGVLHRDLKPSNILLVKAKGGRGRAKLLDFGLARLESGNGTGTTSAPLSKTEVAAPAGAPGPGQLTRESPAPETMTVASRGADPSSIETGLLGTPLDGTAVSGATRPGELVGTPLFMAPERFTGGASSKAADVYALGVVAYSLLTGRTPFAGSLGAIARGHLHEEVRRPTAVAPALPPEVDAPILRSLSKQPTKRQGSAGELAAELAAALAPERRRRWRRRELPSRLGAAAALAVLSAVVLGPATSLRPAADLERAAIDARLALSRPRALDPRILVVLLDEASLAAEARALSDMAEPIATTLERAYAAGARGVAIDLILPAAWARSGTFTRFVVGHAGSLTLAAHATPEGVVGTEVLQGLATAALGETEAGRLFGLVNLEEDADGVVRRGRLGFATSEGGRVDSWAAAAARILTGREAAGVPSAGYGPRLAPEGTFFLDFSAVPGPGAVVRWRDLGELLERRPLALEGRLVVLGAQLAGTGDDALRVPAGRTGSTRVPGAIVQARAVDTILSAFPVREASGWIVMLWVATAVGAGVLALLCIRSMRWAISAVGLIAAWLVVVAAAAFRFGGWLVPVAAPLLLLLAAGALALSARRVLPPCPA
jgi:serine/threonine protein kinase